MLSTDCRPCFARARVCHPRSSNDVSQSYLSGTFPPEFGSLKKLKCMYFQDSDYLEISCDVFSSSAAKAVIGV